MKTDPKSMYFYSQIILISIFILFTSSPLVKTIVSPHQELSEIEKRKLTALPLLSFEKQNLISYPTRFEAYFKDQFGFRDTLIFFRNYIIFKLLKKSPVPSVIIGKEGWLFYKTDTFGISLSDDFRGLIRLTHLQLEAMRIHLETKRNWLASKGIKYLYVAVPNKQSIYPEYMPNYLNKVRDATQYDQLFEYMNQNSDLHILDLRKILLESKAKIPLYYRTDSHWNDKGAFVAYKDILKNLQKFYPALEPINEPEMETRNCSEKDLATLMGLPELIEKDVPSAKINSIHAIKNNNPEWALKSWPWWTQPFETTNRKAKLRAIVFRDSFIDTMLPFFAKHFEKAAYIASKFDYSIVTDLSDKIHPDIVIEEGIERHTFLAFLPEAIHATIGNDLLISGKVAETILEFQKALQIKPDDPDSYNNLGFALLKTRRFDEAISYFKKAIELDPNHGKAHKNLQMALDITKKINAAIAEARKKLAFNTKNPDLHFELGQLYHQRGNREKAISHFQKVLAIQPENFNALNSLAIEYSIGKEYEKAISFFKKAIEFKPDKTNIYYNIACLYSRQNKIKKSVLWLKKAIEKGYDNLSLIKRDSDLDNIRGSEEYVELIEKIN